SCHFSALRRGSFDKFLGENLHKRVNSGEQPWKDESGGVPESELARFFPARVAIIIEDFIERPGGNLRFDLGNGEAIRLISRRRKQRFSQPNCSGVDCRRVHKTQCALQLYAAPLNNDK